MTETENKSETGQGHTAPKIAAPRKIAVIQMTSSRHFEKNLEFLKENITKAAEAGAVYVQTPENSLIMDFDGARIAKVVASSAYKVGLAELIELADKLNMIVHLGSVATELEGAVNESNGRSKLANRSYLMRPDVSDAGDMTAPDVKIYDKIHMFDVTLPNGDVYLESKNYQAGDKSVLVDCGFAKLGMTICYDLRFPALYRKLAQAGAEMISVPAAFTKITGRAHWHTLLKARAIETGSFIIASAQTGEHDSGSSASGSGGRETFGHSLVVAPWGEVILDAGVEPGCYFAELDFDQCRLARETVPSLTHDRAFT